MVDAVIFGQVIPDLEAPNIAREVVLRSELRPETDAYALGRACATGLQAVVCGAQHIETGLADCVIAGGAESASHAPVTVSESLREALIDLQQASSWAESAKALASLQLKDLKPEWPQLREPSTGLTMGESAERMAQLGGITRAAQDDYAHRSQQQAAEAWQNGFFDGHTMTVYPPPHESFVRCDQTVRFDSQRDAYDDLEPVFDQEFGTLTAGNSSPLTDGASAVLLAERQFAEEQGLSIRGSIRSVASRAVNPFDQLLIGPAYSMPEALRAGGLSWRDVDVIDLHEAFAAQVLSVEQHIADQHEASDAPNFAARLNPSGGSIALGHPFAATGGRQVLQAVAELQQRRAQHALVSACAAGGLSVSLIIQGIAHAD